MQARTIYIYAGILGALGVLLGAFGAHALKEHAAQEMVQAWEKAVQYQLIHVLALLFLPTLIKNGDTNFFKWTGICWIIGILLFSGSIYILVLTNLKGLGPVTPVGGLAFIAGWISLIIGAFKLKK